MAGGTQKETYSRRLETPFNEAGHHSLRTQLATSGIPAVARAAVLGHRMPGTARVYEHVTPEMEERVLRVLETLWAQRVRALTPAERECLFSMAPGLEELYREDTKNGPPEEPASKVTSQISPIAG